MFLGEAAHHHLKGRIREHAGNTENRRSLDAGIGIAVMPEVAAKRCARSMKINIVRIRDSWANRRLVICARSFKSLPRPAQQLSEHLRKTASR